MSAMYRKSDAKSAVMHAMNTPPTPGAVTGQIVEVNGGLLMR